jgi:hypothetical protein
MEVRYVDLGVPSTWGPEYWLVLDSLTFLSDAAFDWREALTKSATGGKYDKRMVYYDAQNAVENVLALLTGESPSNKCYRYHSHSIYR